MLILYDLHKWRSPEAYTNEPERNKVWTKFHEWDSINHEIISSAFSVRRHTHEYQYKYHEPVDHFGIVSGQQHKKSFQEKVEEERNAIKYQLQKLQLFHDKIDLQHYASNVIPLVTTKGNEDIENLIKLLNRFHKVAQKLRDRHSNRATIMLNDEYDVQDLLYGLLQIHFEDIRKEDFSPSHAGANSRIDFVLKLQGIVLEVKMTNENLKDNKLGEELLIDIGRYKEYPGCKNFVIFIYDKGDFITNKPGLIRDLTRHSTSSYKVTVVINPQ